MIHPQGREDVSSNVFLERLTRYSLDDVASKRQRVIRIRWHSTRRKNPRRHRGDKVISQRPHLLRAGNEKILQRLFKPSRVSENSAQRNRLRVSLRDREVEVIVH